MEPQRRLLILAAIGFVVVSILIIVLAIILAPKPVATGVKFIVVPDEIQIVAGEKRFKVNFDSTIAFEPGEYTLKLSREHFKEQEEKVIVKEGEVTSLYMQLEASDETGMKILKEEKYLSRIERIAGFKVTSGAEKLTKEYPFINKLPITGKYYYIFPCIVNKETKEYGACVKLALEGDFYKEQALQALRDKDIDPATITVQFQ